MNDIYLQGEIYQNVMPAQFGRPDHWNTETEAEHNDAQQAYFEYIKSFSSIRVFGKHKFIDFEIVVINQDYKTENICSAPNCSCMRGVPPYCRYNSQGEKVAHYIKKT